MLCWVHADDSRLKEVFKRNSVIFVCLQREKLVVNQVFIDFFPQLQEVLIANFFLVRKDFVDHRFVSLSEFFLCCRDSACVNLHLFNLASTRDGLRTQVLQYLAELVMVHQVVWLLQKLFAHRIERHLQQQNAEEELSEFDLAAVVRINDAQSLW